MKPALEFDLNVSGDSEAQGRCSILTTWLEWLVFSGASVRSRRDKEKGQEEGRER